MTVEKPARTCETCGDRYSRIEPCGECLDRALEYIEECKIKRAVIDETDERYGIHWRLPDAATAED